MANYVKLLEAISLEESVDSFGGLQLRPDHGDSINNGQLKKMLEMMQSPDMRHIVNKCQQDLW